MTKSILDKLRSVCDKHELWVIEQRLSEPKTVKPIIGADEARCPCGSKDGAK
jgi:hypothetical protein